MGSLGSGNNRRVSGLLAGREGEQHIAAHAAGAGVARADVEHAIGDDWTGAIDTAAAGFDSVDCGEIADRIEVPEDFAVFGGVGAQMAVEGTGEGDTGNGGDGGGLRGTAAGFIATELRLGVPGLFAVADTEGGEAAALLGIVAGSAPADYVGSGGVKLFAVTGHAPLDAAIHAAFSDVHLPKDLAFLVGIESVDHAGLLAGEQNVMVID